ncbi:MAG: hypothetical protein GTN36_00145 [Candidatus Aenigmarchaeota archaeon]|nr:hypothetical protein [Candidatus Aenigmarchaeota archaeon]
MKKALRYLGYLSLVFGLSLLGVVFLYYTIVLSASIGILLVDDALYNYIREAIGLNFTQMYHNLFYMIFSLGSVGAILTYIGSNIIPRIIKEYL